MSNAYWEADRRDLADFLAPYGPFVRAMDIGCAAGRLGEALLARRIVSACDGIEPDPTAASHARERYDSVIEGRLESVCKEIKWQQYDLLIMADVLEHLIDPWRMLTLLHANAACGARLAISVPNVRHKSVLFPLLFQGRFEYARAGIMDRTHLHFFTRSSLRQTLHDAGWKLIGEQLNIKRKYLRPWWPHRLLGEFLAVQCFALAQK